MSALSCFVQRSGILAISRIDNWAGCEQQMRKVLRRALLERHIVVAARSLVHARETGRRPLAKYYRCCFGRIGPVSRKPQPEYVTSQGHRLSDNCSSLPFHQLQTVILSEIEGHVSATRCVATLQTHIGFDVESRKLISLLCNVIVCISWPFGW